MISVQSEDFDLCHEYKQLRENADSDGAIVTFTGLVRDFNTLGSVSAIEILAGKSVVFFDTDMNGNATGSAITTTAPLDTLAIHNPNASDIDVEIVIATA